MCRRKTGFFTRSGLPVREGDILQGIHMGHKRIEVVEFYIGNVDFFSVSGYVIDLDLMSFSNDHLNAERIGNVEQNPELIPAKNTIRNR